jgi:hypothetical protein
LIKLSNEGYPFFIFGICVEYLKESYDPMSEHEWWLKKFEGKELDFQNEIKDE